MAGPVVPQPCVQTANISATGPALEIVVGILLLTIYPEIKRDVISCLYESEQIPRYGRLEDSHYAGLRPQRYESLFQLDAFLASEGQEPDYQHQRLYALLAYSGELSVCSSQVVNRIGEDFMGRRVHPQKRSVSWVESVLRQFVPYGQLTVDAWNPETQVTGANVRCQPQNQSK